MVSGYAADTPRRRRRRRKEEEASNEPTYHRLCECVAGRIGSTKRLRLGIGLSRCLWRRLLSRRLGRQRLSRSRWERRLSRSRGRHRGSRSLWRGRRCRSGGRHRLSPSGRQHRLWRRRLSRRLLWRRLWQLSRRLLWRDRRRHPRLYVRRRRSGCSCRCRSHVGGIRSSEHQLLSAALLPAASLVAAPPCASPKPPLGDARCSPVSGG
jgi:hypothetical protein